MAKKRREADRLGGDGAVTSAAGLAGATVVLASLIVGAFFAWTQWARPVVFAKQLKILPENVQIPPPPPWVRADIKAEVFRDGSLADASALESDLTPRIAHAFELHPWVAAVTRVSKRAPANVVVDLEYRRPIAWVEVPAGMYAGQTVQGALPIDSESVLLPNADFQEDDLNRLIRINIEGLSISGPPGAPWGDPRVAGAAAIAAAIGEQWRELGLSQIKAFADFSLANNPARTRYELYAIDGRRLIWGSAPGHEPPGEPAAAAKVRLLRDYVQRRGPLNNGKGLGLDLRNADSIRTAKLPH